MVFREGGLEEEQEGMFWIQIQVLVQPPYQQELFFELLPMYMNLLMIGMCIVFKAAERSCLFFCLFVF